MRRSGFWRHLGTVLAIAAITVVLCETVSFFALRILLPPSALAIYRDRLVSGGNVASVKGLLDQRWRTAEFDVAVRTNSRGYREDFDFALADVEFAFMGDSFTFGHGVEAGERYTNLFAARLKGKIDPARVVSLGAITAFSPSTTNIS